MNWNQIAGLLRNVLTFAGGFLVARGWVTADMLPEVVAAVVTLAGVGWSIMNHTNASTVAKAAALVYVPPGEQAKVGIEEPVHRAVGRMEQSEKDRGEGR